MKINLSKILRYILIILINILFIFVLQYYLNLQSSINNSLSDLKIAMFVDNSSEKTEDDILSEMLKYKKNVVNTTFYFEYGIRAIALALFISLAICL